MDAAHIDDVLCHAKEPSVQVVDSTFQPTLMSISLINPEIVAHLMQLGRLQTWLYAIPCQTEL
jgi:hypothetical protein